MVVTCCCRQVFGLIGMSFPVLLLYVVPIVVPFVAYLLDRGERWSERNKKQTLVDAIVVLIAMWRVIGNVPFVSGHTLFLSYCIITSRSLGCSINGPHSHGSNRVLEVFCLA